MQLCIICKKNKITDTTIESSNDVNKICKSCYDINNFCIKCMVNLLNSNSNFCDKCEYLYQHNYYTCKHCRRFECYAKKNDPLYNCIFKCPKNYISFKRNYNKIINFIVKNID